MNHFNRRAAIRIAVVCLSLTSVAAPIAWFEMRETAQERLVSFAIEESKRLLEHFEALSSPNSELATSKAYQAAETLTGGLFDIAKIYDRNGVMLAESSTIDGQRADSELPPPTESVYDRVEYQNLNLRDQWAFRVFVPIHVGSQSESKIVGHFEGVRIIPEWQRKDLGDSALSAALIAGLAALLCGIAIYPLIVRLSAENEREAREVLDSHIMLMEALGRAIAKRDSDTGAHNYRVAWISARIGEEMGLHGGTMQSLIAGSLLHDVGKIGIPDSILLKPAALSADELEIMRTHVALGEDIVSSSGWLGAAREVVAGHHEQWAGNGYPRRLAGQGIPLVARIFAIADVFDALSSQRPYKKAIAFPEVMSILRMESGRHFDPDIFRVFERVADEISTHLQDVSEQHAQRLLDEKIQRHFGVPRTRSIEGQAPKSDCLPA